jgi:hypothetical protein
MYVTMYLLLGNVVFLVSAVIIKTRVEGLEWEAFRVRRIRGGGNVVEEGLEGIILRFNLTKDTFRFTVPSAVALLNYKM